MARTRASPCIGSPRPPRSRNLSIVVSASLRRRPREGGDPYAVASRWGTMVATFLPAVVMGPAFAGTTAEYDAPHHHLLVIALAFCPGMVAPVPVFVLHQGQSTGGNQCQSRPGP